MSRPPLAPELQPRLIELALPMPRALLNRTERELRVKAGQDDDGCQGFYPGFTSVSAQLPASRAFAEAWPIVEHQGSQFTFDWIKFSRGQLPRSEGYHLDSSQATGLGVEALDERLVPRARIRRILANLHAADRTVGWLDIDASHLRWQETQGFVNLVPDELLEARDEQILVIPRRGDADKKLPRVIDETGIASPLYKPAMSFSAAVLCVSQVAHGARETEMGHFLASWSRLEAV